MFFQQFWGHDARLDARPIQQVLDVSHSALILSQCATVTEDKQVACCQACFKRNVMSAFLVSMSCNDWDGGSQGKDAFNITFAFHDTNTLVTMCIWLLWDMTSVFCRQCQNVARSLSRMRWKRPCSRPPPEGWFACSMLSAKLSVIKRTPWLEALDPEYALLICSCLVPCVHGNLWSCLRGCSSYRRLWRYLCRAFLLRSVL